MDALKAGAHKVQEVVQGKKADDKLDKATDPTARPSDRADAAHDAVKAQIKSEEHGAKSECCSNKR